MKKLIFIFVLFLSFTTLAQQRITRGPDTGEIYFTGPTVTLFYDAFYHSTDFGETAVCVDSITGASVIIGAIVADKTPGGLYYTDIYERLFYSEKNGEYGTWDFRSGGIFSILHSGITEGFIYEGAASHSEDYGFNFVNHQGNGSFGIFMESEIGYNNKGYLITYELGGNDTLYFFVSYDKFENLELVNKFPDGELGLHDLSYGSIDGELYYYNSVKKELLYSDNDGYEWVSKNTFFCPNLPIKGITGGMQEGELYMLVEYLQLMGQRLHVYIHHSLDYGETFTVYHPVSIGPNPIYADFMAEETLVEPGDTVQFTDLSNDADEWLWDFNNDSIADSYEQNPTYVYQDTGYYTVWLCVSGEVVIQDCAVRYDYIHVVDFTNADSKKTTNENIHVFPNPVTDKINISLSTGHDQIIYINLYNLQGAPVGSYKIQKDNEHDPVSIPVYDLPDGVYFLKINSVKQSQAKKIIINR